MTVLVRGAGGAIYERHLAGGAWTPWASLGGPDVVRPGPRGLRRRAARVRRRNGPRRLRERAARAGLVGLAVARRRRELGAGRRRAPGHPVPRPGRPRHRQRDPPPRVRARVGLVAVGEPRRQPHERAVAQLAGPGRAERLVPRRGRPAGPEGVERLGVADWCPLGGVAPRRARRVQPRGRTSSTCSSAAPTGRCTSAPGPARRAGSTGSGSTPRRSTRRRPPRPTSPAISPSSPARRGPRGQGSRGRRRRLGAVDGLRAGGAARAAAAAGRGRAREADDGRPLHAARGPAQGQPQDPQAQRQGAARASARSCSSSSAGRAAPTAAGPTCGACGSTARPAPPGGVYARAVYTRKGSRRLHRKTVSKRFVMCS